MRRVIMSDGRCYVIMNNGELVAEHEYEYVRRRYVDYKYDKYNREEEEKPTRKQRIANLNL